MTFGVYGPAEGGKLLRLTDGQSILITEHGPDFNIRLRWNLYLYFDGVIAVSLVGQFPSSDADIQCSIVGCRRVWRRRYNRKGQ